MKAKGVKIRHRTDRNCIRVTPLMWRPYPEDRLWDPCNLCKVIHSHKTIHFWLGPEGETIIAADLWPEIQKIGPKHGMEKADGFSYVNDVKKPPTLGVTGGVGATPDHPRTAQDNTSRSQVIYGSEVQMKKGSISHG